MRVTDNAKGRGGSSLVNRTLNRQDLKLSHHNARDLVNTHTKKGKKRLITQLLTSFVFTEYFDRASKLLQSTNLL